MKMPDQCPYDSDTCNHARQDLSNGAQALGRCDRCREDFIAELMGIGHRYESHVDVT